MIHLISFSSPRPEEGESISTEVRGQESHHNSLPTTPLLHGVAVALQLVVLTKEPDSAVADQDVGAVAVLSLGRRHLDPSRLNIKKTPELLSSN
jgi:hypothetical protein